MSDSIELKIAELGRLLTQALKLAAEIDLDNKLLRLENRYLDRKNAHKCNDYLCDECDRWYMQQRKELS